MRRSLANRENAGPSSPGWATPALAIAVVAAAIGLTLGLALSMRNTVKIPRSLIVPVATPGPGHHHHKPGPHGTMPPAAIITPTPAGPTVVTPDRQVVTASPEPDDRRDNSRPDAAEPSSKE